MKIVKDGYPLIWGFPVVFGILGSIVQRQCQLGGAALYLLGVAGCLLMMHFFRDPERTPQGGEDDFVSGAEGVVRSVETVEEKRFLKCEAVRIRVCPGPFDVRVNRYPMGGVPKEAGCTPGKDLSAMDARSGESGEHGPLLIEGEKTRCLVRGAVRRPQPGDRVEKGARLGMTMFGARMDVYFPAADVEAVVKRGDKVRAGETVIARLKRKQGT